MTDFGVTDAGFVPKTLQDILSDFESRQHANIDAALDVSPDQILGQLNGIYARALSELYEVAQVAFDAYDPDRAEGVSLVSLCKLTGTEKNGATYSTVIVEVDLDTGTELVAGTHFVQVTGNPSIRFTPIDSVVRDAPGGVLALPFRAENPGPVAAPAGTLTTIATPVVGWLSATNPDDATLGEPVDSDLKLRERRERALQATGSATVGAIRSDVLELIDAGTGLQFVQSCIVFENTGDTTDANGVPPHAFEVLVYDGTPTSPHSNQIAQAIWDDRSAGIRSYGSSSGTAVDELGASHVVEFSRVSNVPIYIELSVTTTTGYVGDTALKAAIALAANAQYVTPGQDVVALLIRAIPLFVGGVVDVPEADFKIGRAPSPTTDNNVAIGVRELARFDTANITIV